LGYGHAPPVPKVAARDAQDGRGLTALILSTRHQPHDALDHLSKVEDLLDGCAFFAGRRLFLAGR
jgi:hypothetical protein